MKNLFTAIFFLCILLSGTAKAQEQSEADASLNKPHFWWGPKIGVDLASATTSTAVIKSELEGNSQYGIFFQFGRTFYFQPEIYYAIQKQSYAVNTVTHETKVNSLRIPMMLGLRIINLKIISAHVMAGPTASFFLSESDAIPNQTREKSNFLLQGGAGADLFGFITLDIRYGVNLNEAKEKIGQLNWKSGVNMTLGLKFR